MDRASSSHVTLSTRVCEGAEPKVVRPQKALPDWDAYGIREMHSV